MATDSDSLRTLLSPPRQGPVRLALAKALHWNYRLFQSRGRKQPVLERLQSMALVILPGVQNPRLMRSGKFFASQLTPALIAGDAAVLDMGTGSGACAIAAARRARSVVAVDIDQTAVRCARLNVLLNQQESKIDVMQADLFAAVAGRRFDVVLFNPPFLRGKPQSDADRAWRSTDVAERFAAGLGEHLRPGGYALVLLSTFGDAAHFIEEFRRRRFDIAAVAKRRFVNETLVILKLTQRPS